MGIHSRKNQYWGINAHYTSYLQNEQGGWATFHNHHIAHLTDILDEILPPNYYARGEKSLQIATSPLGHDFAARPDITVFRTYEGQSTATEASVEGETPTFMIPAIAALPIESEIDLFAAIIYYVNEDGEGRPVTRIELFSPSNKAPDGNYREYLYRRYHGLETGVHLVEIDYLHETRPPFLTVPTFREQYDFRDYVNHEEGAYPYYIAVTPAQIDEGDWKLQSRYYCFHVDEPIPPISIPLVANEKLRFDFGAAYNRTYQAIRFARIAVDYSQLPVNFESYMSIDQAQIERRMQTIQKAYEAGIDLEEGPFPIEEST